MGKKKIDNVDDRSRHIKLLLYPDNDLHSLIIPKILNHDSLLFDSCKWDFIGIKHNGIQDLESSTKDHYHFYLVFENPIYIRSVCRRFCFVKDDGAADDQFVRVITGRFERALVYLTHLDSPDKEQYPASDLLGSAEMLKKYDSAALSFLTSKSDKRDIFSEVKDWIQSQQGIISSFKMMNYLISHRAFAIRNEPWLKIMWNEHNSRLISFYNKEIANKISEDAETWSLDKLEVSEDDWKQIMGLLGGSICE